MGEHSGAGREESKTSASGRPGAKGCLAALLTKLIPRRLETNGAARVAAAKAKIRDADDGGPPESREAEEGPLISPSPQPERIHHLITVTIPDNSFFDSVVAEVNRLAPGRNLKVTELHVTWEQATSLSPAEIIEALESPELSTPKSDTGVLVMKRELMSLGNELHRRGVRAVWMGTVSTDQVPVVPQIAGDQEQGGYLATHHLIELGHRRIACRGYTTWELFHPLPRGIGHDKAVREARRRGLELFPTFVLDVEFNLWKENLTAARAFWTRPEAPTAVAAWNDPIAMELIDVLERIGLRIPGDVSVIGYDNSPLALKHSVPLSTIDGDITAQVEAALGLLTATSPPPARTEAPHAP